LNMYESTPTPNSSDAGKSNKDSSQNADVRTMDVQKDEEAPRNIGSP
jgi:hypothetical protein